MSHPVEFFAWAAGFGAIVWVVWLMVRPIEWR